MKCKKIYWIYFVIIVQTIWMINKKENQPVKVVGTDPKYIIIMTIYLMFTRNKDNLKSKLKKVIIKIMKRVLKTLIESFKENKQRKEHKLQTHKELERSHLKILIRAAQQHINNYEFYIKNLRFRIFLRHCHEKIKQSNY